MKKIILNIPTKGQKFDNGEPIPEEIALFLKTLAEDVIHSYRMGFRQGFYFVIGGFVIGTVVGGTIYLIRKIHKKDKIKQKKEESK